MLENILSIVELEKSATKTKKNEKSYLEMLINSAIIAGITFFSVWNGTINLDQLLIVLKATGISFCVQLAYEKKIKKVSK